MPRHSNKLYSKITKNIKLANSVLWGMDNNFTRNVSDKDPLSIVKRTKTNDGLMVNNIQELLNWADTNGPKCNEHLAAIFKG